uniref:Uncharacterized protein n=1 Tax=Cacopsylla melanoneura TaxID=428564 RepID=A0A8D8SVU6_9HEMI
MLSTLPSQPRYRGSLFVCLVHCQVNQGIHRGSLFVCLVHCQVNQGIEEACLCLGKRRRREDMTISNNIIQNVQLPNLLKGNTPSFGLYLLDYLLNGVVFDVKMWPIL